MDDNVKYTLRQIKKTAKEMLNLNMPIGFEYCVYDMPLADCQEICRKLENFGFHVSIGHRLGSENTIIVREKE